MGYQVWPPFLGWLHRDAAVTVIQGAHRRRVKPHGQLVLVSRAANGDDFL